MHATVTHYLPITTVRRARLLPVTGKVVVRKGQKVNPSDVVAEANLAPEHLLLEIARGLGLPAEKADTFIQHQAGEEVSQGDVIAGPVGLARRVVRAPKDGRVVVAGGGQVLLELNRPQYELRAALPGVVTQLITDRGVEIETTGALIQGVWGNGCTDYGVLSVLSHSPQDVLSSDKLDVSQRGSILLSGFCSDPDVLAAAGDIPIRGLILSSMDSTLVPVAARMRYPIVVIEGFGNIPMNSIAYKLLSTSDRRDVALIAEVWDRYEGTRPEIVIPLPPSGQLQLPLEAEIFAPGQKVRILGEAHRSSTGTITSLPPGLAVLPSGIHAPAAEVRLESGDNITYPLANLEVLE